jgi:hypothetical protein
MYHIEKNWISSLFANVSLKTFMFVVTSNKLERARAALRCLAIDNGYESYLVNVVGPIVFRSASK